MKLPLIIIVLCTSLGAQAAPFPNGNAQAGQKLFKKYQCNSCHIQMLGGDGSAIFTRANHKVHDAGGLIEQIEVCSGNVGAKLSSDEKQHLAAYLNRYYQLK